MRITQAIEKMLMDERLLRGVFFCVLIIGAVIFYVYLAMVCYPTIEQVYSGKLNVMEGRIDKLEMMNGR